MSHPREQKVFHCASDICSFCTVDLIHLGIHSARCVLLQEERALGFESIAKPADVLEHGEQIYRCDGRDCDFNSLSLDCIKQHLSACRRHAEKLREDGQTVGRRDFPEIVGDARYDDRHFASLRNDRDRVSRVDRHSEGQSSVSDKASREMGYSQDRYSSDIRDQSQSRYSSYDAPSDRYADTGFSYQLRDDQLDRAHYAEDRHGDAGFADSRRPERAYTDSRHGDQGLTNDAPRDFADRHGDLHENRHNISNHDRRDDQMYSDARNAVADRLQGVHSDNVTMDRDTFHSSKTEKQYDRSLSSDTHSSRHLTQNRHLDGDRRVDYGYMDRHEKGTHGSTQGLDDQYRSSHQYDRSLGEKQNVSRAFSSEAQGVRSLSDAQSNEYGLYPASSVGDGGHDRRHGMEQRTDAKDKQGDELYDPFSVGVIGDGSKAPERSHRLDTTKEQHGPGRGTYGATEHRDRSPVRASRDRESHRRRGSRWGDRSPDDSTGASRSKGQTSTQLDIDSRARGSDSGLKPQNGGDTTCSTCHKSFSKKGKNSETQTWLSNIYIYTR